MTPSRTVRFGLHLSTWRLPGGARELGPRLRDVGAAAEEAGVDSLWVMDHLRQIPQLGRPWEDMPDAVAVLAHLAAATRRATVGALVHPVSYRDVRLLGRAVATLDVLSGGRAVCGLGAGWYEAEHHALGLPFPPARERLDALEDALRFLPLFWGKGSPAFAGRAAGRARGDELPAPAAGARADPGRWFRTPPHPADRRPVRRRLQPHREPGRRQRGARRAAASLRGRRPRPGRVEVTHLSTIRIMPDGARPGAAAGARGRVRVVTGTVEDHVLRIEALRAVGVEHVILALEDVWEHGALDGLAELIAAARGPQ